MTYPTRESYFANKYIRLLTSTCAALELGPYATLLCHVIAMQEDAIRYTRGVTFYNSALQNILGIAKWDSLNKARNKAVSKGWLHYEPRGKRQAGMYWVTIPEQHRHQLELKGDGACDNGAPYITPDNGDNTGGNTEGNNEAQHSTTPQNGDKERGNKHPPDETIPATGYNDGYKHGYNDGDKGGEPSYLYLNREPGPINTAQPISENLANMCHVEHDPHPPELNNSLEGEPMSIGLLGILVSFEKHERESAEHLLKQFTSDYLKRSVKGAKEKISNNGQRRRPWLREVIEHIEKHKPKSEDKLPQEQRA